jgi:hypothetical protein
MPQPRIHSTSADRQRAYRQRQAAARDAERSQKGLPAVPAIPSLPGERRWTASITQARALIEQTRDEMQNYHDDRSEEWQESEKAERLIERIEALDALLDDLDTITTG